MAINLVLLDIMLPKIDGFTILRELRKEKDIPILMVTAKREDIDKIRGLGMGADDYVEKPFSPSVLLARIKAHLDRYSRLKGSEIKSEINISGIRLNTETRRVYVDGKEVELKNKEYELLLFLMLNLDHVFSREELYENASFSVCSFLEDMLLTYSVLLRGFGDLSDRSCFGETV